MSISRMLVAALAGMTTIAASAQNSPSADAAAEPKIVPLYSSGPRALAMLTLGDGPPAPVVFDTGTDHNLLTEAYSKRLGLKVVGESEMVDAATGKSARVPVLALNEPRLSGVPVVSAQAQQFAYSEDDMVGVFGPGSFVGSLVTLELSHGRIRISPLSPATIPAGPSTPYRDGLPALDIKVGGMTISAHLDSGATGELALSRDLMDEVKLKAPAQVIGSAISALGRQDVYGGQLDGDVQIGPLRLKDPQVSFIGAAGNGPGANIGYKLMRQMTLVMDPAGQRSWVLDPGSGPGPLTDFVGRFGPRSIRVEGGKLVHQRDGRPAFELRYLGGDLFEMTATGDRVQFYRRAGRVQRLELITAEGQVAPAERTS